MSPDPTGSMPAEGDHDSQQRYGRRRGHLPVGDQFVSRLGPSEGELFAAMDDPAATEIRERPAPDTLIEDIHFVALDCETTGQTPHRLVELGAVAFTLEGPIMSFETLVHSTDRINPFAKRIHGISSESLAGAPPLERVLHRFKDFVQGAVLIEHSADAFDTRLIGRSMREPLPNDNIDTSRLAGKLWELKDTIGLERLCDKLDVHHRRPHHAFADAEATAECFVALVALGREQFGWRTLGDLLVDGQPPPPRPPSERGRRTGAGGETTAGTGPRRRRRGGRRRPIGDSPSSSEGAGGTAPVVSPPPDQPPA